MPYIVIVVGVLLLDQITKIIVQMKIPPFQSINLINNWFLLTYTQNYGAAFSILQSQRLFLILITLVVFAVLWFYRHQLAKYPTIFHYGLAIALGGTLGNFVDRIWLGYVRDFIDLRIWPVFNVADIAIFIGVGLIVLGMFRKEVKLESNAQNSGIEEIIVAKEEH